MAVQDLVWRVDLDGVTVPAREDVGNKARSVALMRRLGLDVPQAFAIPVAVGRLFRAEHHLPEPAWSATRQGVAMLERESGLAFGGDRDPLLVSVRSGAAQSMPGMMDTILDLGINDQVEGALARSSGDAAFARDTHLRFLESYARTVLGVQLEAGPGETPAGFRGRIAEAAGTQVPQDPFEQLRGAVEAVFRSWDSSRAQAYRRHWKLPDDGGTAVTVQRMVYGNLDEESGTGVLFTRNPHSGDAAPLGEFLPGGQGEDVVSGEVDPLDLSALAERMPGVHAALLAAGRLLESDARDVQDVEFTIERGRLFLLQTRNAKRSPVAAVRFAVALANDGMIDRAEALSRVKPAHVEALLQPVLDPEERATATLLASGEPACPGIARGRVVTDAHDAMLAAAAGDEVVLVRHATSPEDIEGMISATGICTEVGGRTSHAAVVSRELGRPAVVGCGVGLQEQLQGRLVTVDGGAGHVYDGMLRLIVPTVADHLELQELAEWALDDRGALEEGHPLLRTVLPTERVSS